MNEQNNPPEKQDDEISLLDLFAVLIRYRRMILGGTLAAGVLCALVLYGGGAIQKSLRQEQEPAAVAALLGDPENQGPDSEYSWILDGNIWNLTYTIRVRNLPAYLDSYLRENFGESTADLLLYFRNVWYDTAFLADLHRQHTLWPPAAEIEDAAEYNGFFLELQKRDQNADSSPGKPQYARFGEVLIWNTTARNPDEPEPDVLSVTLEKLPESAVVPYELDGTGHPPLAQEFISGIVQQANAQAAAGILPLLEALAADPDSRPAVVREANAVLRGGGDFFRLVPDPAVRSAGIGGINRPLAVIIAFFAAFFVLVFCAFLRNAVDSVRRDPSASSLIREAWEAGKRRKKA